MLVKEALSEWFRRLSFYSTSSLYKLGREVPSTPFLNTSKPKAALQDSSWHSWVSPAHNKSHSINCLTISTVFSPLQLVIFYGVFLIQTNPTIVLLQLQWFLRTKNTLLTKICLEVLKKKESDSYFKPLKSVLKGVYWREVLQHFNITSQSTWKTSVVPKKWSTNENTRKLSFSPNTSSVSTQCPITPNGSNGCLIYRYF